ncbi:MAG TPA: zinc-binding dehydrogenase [Acidimicrobiales bacterium]|nr:zinc-binding dehydrogenase [Acidimicrobiales bacterium]
MNARVLVLEAARDLRTRELPLPEIGDDDGLLRVEACGLCGTDHEQFTGAIPVFAPYVPGHEIVGIVEAAGDAALARWGVSIGQRVAVEVFMSCRACDACAAGDYRHCAAHPFPEFYGNVPVERSPGLWGGYAEYVYLHRDAVLLPVPDGLDPELATAFNPLGAGIQWGVNVPGTKAGDVVAVLGPGIRGLSAAAAAKDAGASFVMVTGAGERDAARLEMARRFGADLVVDVTEEDPVRALRAAVGDGADVVVDVTAKAPNAFAQAIRLARRRGTVVVAGTRGGGEAPGVNPDEIVYKELKVVGALGVDARAYAPAFATLASRRWPFAELPRDVVGLDGAARLLAVMAGDVADAAPPVHGVVVPQ